MFTRLALSILALAWASVVLASPEPPIKAPALGEIRLPVIDTPTPMPTNPTAVTRLTANQLYVIDSDVPLQVVASRDGFVTITEEAGPLRLRGLFVDDPSGKPKTRTFKGPYLYTVEVVASGQVELVIFRDVKTPALRRTIDVDAGQGPQPPPPKPEPPGPTPPKPDPVTPSKLFLLVIEETESAANNRGAFFADKALSARIKEKDHSWRVVDKDVKNSQGQTPADLVPYLAKIQGKNLPQVLLVDPQGKTRFAGDLPSTPALLLEQILKAGG